MIMNNKKYYDKKNKYSFYSVSSLAAISSGLWYISIIILIALVAILFVFLISYSKKPEQWGHTTNIHEYNIHGRLWDLAESIKVAPVQYNQNTPLKNLTQLELLKKIQIRYSYSDQQMNDLIYKDQDQLEKIIDDQELINWFLNKHNPKSYDKEGLNKRDIYIHNMKNIVEKIKTWGE